MSDTPTLEERHACAVHAKRLDSELTGAAKTIVRAAWSGETLGGLLLRLKAEFDLIRTNAARVERAVCSTRNPPPDVWSVVLTELGLLRMQLPSLTPALEALTSHALRQSRRHAARMRYDQPLEIPGIAMAALGAWLSPSCGHCTGRGVLGSTGGPMAVCRHCGGTGLRAARLHASHDGHEFGRALLTEIERKATRVLEQAARI